MNWTSRRWRGGRCRRSRGDATSDPDGFVLVSSPAGELPVLYPAMNAPLPQKPESGLRAALRFRNHLAGTDAKMLEPVAALPYSPDLQSASAVTPVFDIAVTEANGGEIMVELDGVTHTLAPNTPTALAVKERTVSLKEFADAVLDAYAAAGVPKADMPSREAVVEEVTLSAFGGEDVTFHARIVAVNHGSVALGDIDLATIWEDARRPIARGSL